MRRITFASPRRGIRRGTRRRSATLLAVERFEQRCLLSELEVIGNPTALITAMADGTTQQKILPLSIDGAAVSAQALNADATTEAIGPLVLNTPETSDSVGASFEAGVPANGAAFGSIEVAQLWLKLVPDAGDPSDLLSDVTIGTTAGTYFQGGAGSTTSTVTYDAGNYGQGTIDASLATVVDGIQYKSATLSKVPLNTVITLTYAFSANLSANQLGDTSNINDSFSWAISSPPTIGVTATYSNLDGGEFGPYLAGVRLPNVFTATVDNAPSTVAGLTYSIDGKLAGSATPSGPFGSGPWQFDPDVGSLDPGDHQLTVTAVDAAGKPVVFDGNPVSETSTIVVQNTLDFSSLTATYSGGSGPVDTSNLRFISGIPLTPKFQETVSDIPSYYANSTEFPDVQLGGSREPINWATPAGEKGDTFTFTHNVKTLAPGQTDAELLTPVGDGLGVPFPDNTDDSYLYAISLPTWMGTPSKADVETGAQVQSALGVDGGYVINFSVGLGAKLASMTQTSGTPLDLGTVFNGLNSSISTGLNFTLYATVDDLLPTSQAVVRPNDWRLTADLLGGPNLINQSADLSNLKGISVEADLDVQTLAAPTQIDITASDIDLYSLVSQNTISFDLPFGTGTRTFQLPVDVPILGFLGLSLKAEMDLEGDLQATLDDLTGDAELAIDLNGGTPTLDPTLSYISISAQASAALTLQATGSLSAGVTLFHIISIGNSISILKAKAVGQIDADVDLYGQFDLSGPLTSPSITFDTAQSYASAEIDGGLSFDWSVFGEPNPPPPDLNLTPRTFALFGKPPGIQSSLSDPNEAALNGPGQKGSPGYPGVQPTSDNALALLGPATGTAASSSTISTTSISPTSTLSILPPVYAADTDITFDLNVVAAQSQLTPGHHFLDAVLVDPGGNEIPLDQVDLAGLALAVNNNPLGYASGWTTIDLPSPTSQMNPVVPYRLVFRFTDDLAGTGESVAVALDNLKVTEPAPALGVTTPGSSLVGDQLVFGPGTGGAASATVQLEDIGNAPLIIEDLGIVGAGFSVPGALQGPFALEPGETLEVPIQLTDLADSNSATFQATSDDPDQPTYRLPLVYDGTSLASQGPQPIAFSTVASPRNAAVAGVDVTFDDAINSATLDWHDLSLRLDGGPNLITGAVTIDLVVGSTYQIGGLTGLTRAEGTYVLTVSASGIHDPAGHSGSGSLSTSWLMDTTPPTATVSRLPRTGTGLSFPVTVTGTDPNGADSGAPSDITSFTIYVSTNGGAWQVWATVPPTSISGASTSASATFTGQSNTIYAFYATATDFAGNAQADRPSIEASTYLPDLTPPVTSVNASTGTAPSSVNAATGTFTLNLTGAVPGGKPLTAFQVYVAIDAQTPVPIGPAIPAGFPDANGAYHATIAYQGLTDEVSHRYTFTSIGIDGAGLVQTAPVNPVTFANQSFTAASLQVTGLTVERGASERSYIRYLDVDFNESDAQAGGEPTAIVNSLATSSPEIRLYKYDLNGDASSKTPVPLSGVSASVIDHAIELDFGAAGIGGNASSTASDGYYELDVTVGGTTYEDHFYRLLGDVTGDGAVDNNDLAAIASELALSSPTGYTPLSADVNGDGTVTAFDVTLATRAKGHKLGSGLSLG